MLFCLLPSSGFSSGTPDFAVPFADLGSGVVDTTATSGVAVPTFTRATTAWTRLSSGLWVEVASGAARSYYLSGGTYAGYIAEGARTNPILHSRDLTNAAWTCTNCTPLKNVTGIDGVSNSASRITATGASATALQAVTLSSTARTFSPFVKRITGTGTIEITLDNGSTWTDITASINSTDWYWSGATQTLANPTFGFRITTSGDAIAVDMCDGQNGSFASTPVPTTTAAVTRNADVLTYPFILNAGRGTVYCETALIHQGAAATTFALFGFAASGPGLLVNGAGADTEAIMFDGTNTVTKVSLTSNFNSVQKKAGSWGSLGLIVTGAGAAVSSGSFDGDIGSTAIAIGVDGDGVGNNLFGTIKNARGWLAQASAAQLQSITA